MSTRAEQRVRIDSPEALQQAMGADFPPSPQQWEVITAPLEPGVVIAGAGSGKTTLMATRVVYLVLTGQVRPDQILGLTFTSKAASELRERIGRSLLKAGVRFDAAAIDPGNPRDPDADAPGELLEPTVSTYHAYAAQLLTEHGLRIGHEPDTRVIADASRYQLGARVVERFPGTVEHLSDHPPTVIGYLLGLDQAMSEHLTDEEAVRAADAAARAGFVRAIEEEKLGKGRKTFLGKPEASIRAIDRRSELLGMVAAYRTLKRELGVMDFADQIELAARLAAEQPEVGAAEREKYRVVLLDEYQDTSVAQALLLSRLFSGPDAARGRGHAVTAVGDPNQAIYGWRGASVSNIVNFGDFFPRADGGDVPRYPLTVNYRSDSRILELANRLAEPLYESTAHVRPLEPAPHAGQGQVEVSVFETQGEELEWLAGAVREAYSGRPGGWAEIGVLTRDNASAALIFDTLSEAGIPVEIVGLSGLVRLPEVAEVVATLHLLVDVTHNPSLLTLLVGSRWAIGPRDLHLLQQRAAELAGHRAGRSAPPGLAEELTEIAEGSDPAEIECLLDALEDPGEADYSDEARERFDLLAGELRMLRRHSSEPLLDVVRRIIDSSGVDVELASSPSPAAAARRENLDLFVKAVADFAPVDGDVSLNALVAYLTAEDESGNGLDAATPSEADSVKLLTVHRAKGLEWDTVFLAGVSLTKFPSTQGRAMWTSTPAVLPTELRGDAADQARLTGYDKPALEALRAAAKAIEADEELRLAYVAFTRAAHTLHLSAYCWTQRSTPFGPSPYLVTAKEQLDAWGQQPAQWREAPAKGDPNPVAAATVLRTWPEPAGSQEARWRSEAAARVRAAVPEAMDLDLDADQAALVDAWDAEMERLLAEARERRAELVRVPLPESLSATSWGRLHEDPAGFAQDLARPMPRRPAPSARFGTRFHAWVEARFGQQDLIPYDELPGRADLGIDDDADLAEVVRRFEEGPFADRRPHAVEAPFSLVLAGQVVRGRIDAVYTDGPDGSDDPGSPGSPGNPGSPDGSPGEPGYLVVDWKTGRREDADPWQLALYRLAWAELAGVEVERVRAVFHYVRSGRTVEPGGLPDRDGLEMMLRTGTGALG